MPSSKVIITIFPVCCLNSPEYQFDANGFEEIQMQSGQGFLTFENQQLNFDNADELENVAKKIEEFKNLKVLELKGNTIGLNAKDRLSQALLKHPELERCLWSDIFTGRLKTEIPIILKSLCDAMIHSQCKITELDLSDNAFGKIGVDGISHFLDNAYHLNTLKLNNNGLGLGGKDVATSLIKCYQNSIKNGHRFQLKRFVSGRNRLENPGAEALAEAFSVLQTLEEIVMPQNGIRKEGIMCLAKSFEKNKQLKVINLNDNISTEKGAYELAKAISCLDGLIDIDVGDCLVRGKGAMRIVEALVNSSKNCLKTVDLSGNELNDKNIDAIIATIGNRLPNVRINLSCNNMGGRFDEMRNTYHSDRFDFGESDTDLGTLSPCSSDYEDEQEEDDDQQLANIMSNSMSIGDSNLKDTLSFFGEALKINTSKDAQYIVDKIKSMKFMRTLELRGNTIGVEGGEKIARALEEHGELENCLWSDIFTGRLKTEIPPILIAFGKAMIKAGCKIHELDLSDNAFGPIGADGVKELLESRSCFDLKVLKLNNNGLGRGGGVIAQSLNNCYRNSNKVGTDPFQLKVFVAGRNRLEDYGATKLAETFKLLGSLEVVEIPQNGITKIGITEIAKSLKENKNLRVLNINDNTALQLGAHEIAQSLQYLTFLEVLDMGDCLCRDQGCHSIVDALKPDVHKNLKVVNLSGADMSPQCAQIIIRKWSKFNGFATKPVLRIGGNCFGGLYSDIAELAPENVDVGDEDDDCGSLSDDEEEIMSNSESDDDDEEEEDIEDSEEDSGEMLNDVEIESLIEQIKNEYDNRVQEESAKGILKLSKLLEQCMSNEMWTNKIIKIAEEIVLRVDCVKRNPIPTTTQLVNQLVAQCKTLGVKSEYDFGITANPKFVGILLKSLVRRGQFVLERDLIKHYFTDC